MTQLLQTPMQARGSEIRRDGLQRYVRHEYGERNPYWISYQATVSYRMNGAKHRSRSRLTLVFVARVARAVASFFL